MSNISCLLCFQSCFCTDVFDACPPFQVIAIFHLFPGLGLLYGYTACNNRESWANTVLFRSRRITGRLGELNINFVGGSRNCNKIEKMDWMLDQ